MTYTIPHEVLWFTTHKARTNSQQHDSEAVQRNNLSPVMRIARPELSDLASWTADLAGRHEA